MDFSSLLAHIDGYWPRLIRRAPRQQGTLIALPHPYLVPTDKGMFDEMYYWDSFFTALGLPGTPYESLIPGLAENLGSLYRRFGVIPNGSRYYFMSRSQPPFFTQLIWLAHDSMARSDAEAAEKLLARLMRLAESEHEVVWMGTAQPHFRRVHEGLSRYFDINFLDVLAATESGWDHTTRCDDRWLEHLPVDLNAILYARERDIARAYGHLGQHGQRQAWEVRAETRAETMRRLLWDEAAGFFFDYDWKNQTRTLHASLAGFFPLWAGLATPEQATRVVQEWLPRFSFPGGLVTTLEERHDRQWAYPNGWAPLHWIVTEGMDRYGFREEAMTIRRNWCTNCLAVFEKTGDLWEKYNVVAVSTEPEPGLYGTLAGFGWTNAVTRVFIGKLVEDQSPGRS
jgi:alpha,alpha-trehalase